MGGIVKTVNQTTVFTPGTSAIAAAASAAQALAAAQTATAILAAAGSNTLMSLPATEALAARALVNLWDNGGVLSMRNAVATDPNKTADGYVPSAVASGASGNFATVGLILTDLGATGDAWLSPTTPGAMTLTQPTTAGQVAQKVGRAMKGQGVLFRPSEGVLL